MDFDFSDKSLTKTKSQDTMKALTEHMSTSCSYVQRRGILEWEEERLLFKIAQLYYEQDYTQAEISKELGIYRTTVGRMLKKAKKEGIVKIEVKSKINEQIDIEEKIRKHFGMKEIVIVPSRNAATRFDVEQLIGKACSELLNRVVKDQDVIGSAWGTTLGNMVSQLSGISPKNVECVPLVGGPGEMNVDFHVNAIVYKLAEIFAGKSYFIDAVAVYKSSETTQEILSASFMKKILELWQNLTIAIVGIGSQTSSSNMVWSGILGESDRNLLEEHKVVGDICSRFYTLSGELIESDLSKRTVSIELENLKNLNYSIGVAYSKDKVDSIIGAMRGEFINVLVTDEETALRIVGAMDIPEIESGR